MNVQGKGILMQEVYKMVLNIKDLKDIQDYLRNQHNIIIGFSSIKDSEEWRIFEIK